MASVVAPDVEATGNLLGMENVGHLLVHVAAHVVDAGGEDTGVATIGVEVMSIAHVWHVVGGEVEVTVLVVVAGEKAGGVERTSHGEDSGEDLGITEGNIDRMVTTKAAPDGAEAGTGTAVAVVNEGDNLFEDVVLETKVPGDPSAWNDGAVVPAFGVNGINTKELQVTSFELVPDGVDHAAVLEVEEASAGGRKGDCWWPGMSEDEDFHLPPEGRR